MGSITANGLMRAEQKMRDRAQRVRDLSPVFKLIGEDLIKETSDAFRKSRSPLGEPWDDIKDATKLGRKSVRKRAGERTSKGARTKRAMTFRQGLLEQSKPLVDTGRMRNSPHTITQRRRLRFSMVGYTGPHITGDKSGNLPKRNPTAFENVGGRWRLIPRLRQKYVQKIIQHVEGRR